MKFFYFGITTIQRLPIFLSRSWVPVKFSCALPPVASAVATSTTMGRLGAGYQTIVMGTKLPEKSPLSAMEWRDSLSPAPDLVQLNHCFRI